jgi:ribonuclease P protein component
MRPSPRPVYRRRHRLTHALEFKAVFDARLKAPMGPMLLFARPNTLGHLRLGLSIGRKVGGAVQRNALKRRLREAFRAVAAERAHDAQGLDVVISARPHERRTPSEYAALLKAGLARLEAVARRWETGP